MPPHLTYVNSSPAARRRAFGGRKRLAERAGYYLIEIFGERRETLGVVAAQAEDLNVTKRRKR